MKAPEKIYLEAIYPDNGVLPNGLNYTPSPTDIEYIRTDVFIDKAVERLKDYLDNGVWVANDVGVREKEVIIDDFRMYMKGE